MKTMILCFIISISSCTYGSEEELLRSFDCNSTEVNFSNHISPIIEQNCAVTSCHVNGSQQPDLGNFISVVNNSERVKFMINNGTMPPSNSGKSLSEEEKLKINCWIEGGMPQ